MSIAGLIEFPASCNMLFDASVTDYLSIEDIVVLAGIVAGRICKADSKS